MAKSLEMFPQGVATGILGCQVPNTSIGDFTVVRNTECDQINILGVSEEVGVNVTRVDYKKDFVPTTDNSFYSFDGDNVDLPNPTVSVVTNPFSDVIKFKTGSNVTSVQVLYANTLNTSNRLGIGIRGGNFVFSTFDGATNNTVAYPVLANTEYVFTVTKDDTHTQKKIYLNGQIVSTIGSPQIQSSVLGQVIGEGTTGLDNFLGQIYYTETYNLELTAQEVLDRFNGIKIPSKYVGATNETITAGAFNVGKEYQILVPGTTDFTLIGAVDSVIGTKFKATGVGSGTGTATSIGNTLDLSTGKAIAFWYDLSHDIIGTVSGATLSGSTDFGNNAHGIEACPVLLTEPSFTNHFLNSRVPVTQTVTGLSVGTTYTINAKGTGIIQVSETGGSGQGGTVTEVYPLTYTATVTSVVITLVAGEAFDWVQLSDTPYPVNHVETLGVSITKAKDDVFGAGDVNTFDSISGVLEIDTAIIGIPNPSAMNVTLSDGTNSNRVRMETLFFSSNTIRFQVHIGGVQDYIFDHTFDDITESNIIKFKYGDQGYGIKINGVEVDSASSTNSFAANTLNVLSLQSPVSSNSFYARTKNIKTFKGIESY